MANASDKLTTAAQRFLRTGRSGDLQAADLILACDKLVRLTVEKSSGEAIKLGKMFVKRTQSYPAADRATALRALAWACHIGGRYALAEESFLNARELLKREPIERARIDRVLLDVYMYQNRFREANRRAQMAIRSFERHNADADLARAQVNYANLLHRQDRHSEALDLYHEARVYFEGQSQDLPAAFCQHNEANVLVQLFEFDEAALLYETARRAFKHHEYHLHEAGCRYGMAWLWMLKGKYHEALGALSECEADYLKASQPREVVLCQLDRAEAYLGLNLFSDALQAAQSAEKGARKLGIKYEAAKGALFVALAAPALGRSSLGLKALARAERDFDKEKNEPFGGVVSLLRARGLDDIEQRFQEIAEARARFGSAQLPLWEAICDLQILSECPDEQAALSRLEANPAVETVPHLKARWLTMLGDRDARRGQLTDAKRYWKLACDLLDGVRAKLPPLDLRTEFGRLEGLPHVKLTRAELCDSPRLAAAWSERHKTAGLWQQDVDNLGNHPARARAEASLSSLASRVTAISSRIDNRIGKRSAGLAAANRTLGNMQAEVRRSMADLDAGIASLPESVDEICKTINQVAAVQPIVQFHESNEHLMAFIHDGQETRVHQYDGGTNMVRHFHAMWRFLMEQAADRGTESKSYLKDEAELLSRMGRGLLDPLCIPSDCSRLLILPEGGLSNLPWPALTYRGESLITNYELVFAPSLRHHVAASAGTCTSDRVEVFISEADDLPQVHTEADLFTSFEGDGLSIHRSCCRADWPNNSSSRIWHFAGHARQCLDNPFYSSLEMSDGPMFAADFRLRRNDVSLVTLAACRTGDAPAMAGEESSGLVRAMLEMGAHNVLASHWAVADSSTADWMRHFYTLLAEGTAISTAVRQTSMSLRERYPSAYNWASFEVYGAGQ